MSRRRFIQQAGVMAAGAWLGAPAVHAQTKFEWKMATSWPKDFPGLGTGANYLAQAIAEMSGNRLAITVYGGGELVPPLGVFDAVSKGTAEMGHSAAYSGYLPRASHAQLSMRGGGQITRSSRRTPRCCRLLLSGSAAYDRPKQATREGLITW